MIEVSKPEQMSSPETSNLQSVTDGATIEFTATQGHCKSVTSFCRTRQITAAAFVTQ